MTSRTKSDPAKSKMQRIIVIAIVVTVLAGLGFVFYPRSENELRRDPERKLFVDVERAISGHKIKLDDDEVVIYNGVRAPYPGEKHFEKVLQRNNELVKGKNVRLRFDKQKRDSRNRTLAYVFVGGNFVNETLVREGLAYVRLTTTTQRFAKRLLAAQADARKHRRGVWQDQRLASMRSYPADPKYGNFHRMTCDEVSKIKPERKTMLSSKRVAFKQGYAPCRHCKP